MNQEDIIRMAREVGLDEMLFACSCEFGNADAKDYTPILERFADLVAAAEREECAKVCYELPWKDMGHIPSNLAFAAAIRARSNT